jgi:acetyl-CoA carboxylase carboxyl transferase subunit alpha
MYDLDFEKPLADLAQQISMLQQKSALSLAEEARLAALQQKLFQQTGDLYAQLSCWQAVQVARHKDRPYAADYLRLLCDDFLELHGDRSFSDDHAIIAGPGEMDGQMVMFIAQQKGRDVKEKQYRNFGMPHPEGYRKAHRLMLQAEKFHFPLVCLVDTPGAFPGLEDEERGQSQAIAANLYLMARLRVPTISVVIGEGGSGGALALSVADRILMLEHSVYTVAAPEAAASILWRDTAFASQAAEAMQISARHLIQTPVVDDLVPEPPGGAHHDHHQTAIHLKTALLKHLHELQQISLDELLERRYQKYRTLGPFQLKSKA